MLRGGTEVLACDNRDRNLDWFWVFKILLLYSLNVHQHRRSIGFIEIHIVELESEKNVFSKNLCIMQKAGSHSLVCTPGPKISAGGWYKGASSTNKASSQYKRFANICFSLSKSRTKLEFVNHLLATNSWYNNSKDGSPTKLSKASKSTSPNRDSNRPQITIAGQLHYPRTYYRARYHRSKCWTTDTSWDQVRRHGSRSSTDTP